MTVTSVDQRPHDPGDHRHQSAGEHVGGRMSYAARVSSGGGPKKKKVECFGHFP